MLVTLTPTFRVHRDEVLSARLRANMVVIRFASLRPVKFSIDDLTPEAREWLLPSLAPRDIPLENDWGAEEEEVRGREDDARQIDDAPAAEKKEK